MAKPNYQFEKRQRDLAKKSKQEEKRRQKLAASVADKPAETGTAQAADTSPAMPGGTGAVLPENGGSHA